MNIELKRCPFCGSVARFGITPEGGEFIECSGKLCHASTKLDFDKWLERTFKRGRAQQLMPGYETVIAPSDSTIILSSWQAHRLAKHIASISTACPICGYPGMETEKCDKCAGVVL